MRADVAAERGALLELDAQILKLFDVQRVRQLHDNVQIERPLLAERLK